MKMVVFQCPQVVWRFQTPIRFPAVKQGLIPWVRSWKNKHLSEWAGRLIAIGVIYFTKKWRAETLQPDGLRIWRFLIPAWKRYLQMHLLVEQLVCLVILMVIGVFWKGVMKTYIYNGLNETSWLPIFFVAFTSIVSGYKLRFQVKWYVSYYGVHWNLLWYLNKVRASLYSVR